MAPEPTTATADPDSRERLLKVKVDTGRYAVLRTTELDWCESDGNYVRLHAGGTTYSTRGTLSDLAAALGSRFIRIHRQTVVNLHRIVELRAAGDRLMVVLADGNRRVVGRAYRHELEAVLL